MPKRSNGHQERTHHHAEFLFSPNEIGIVGVSGAGKTTLATRLLDRLAADRRVAFAKHDAHGFAMDHEGKDTWRASHSGAANVFIGDSEGFAYLGRDALDEWNRYDLYNDADIVLVEGHRRTLIPKLVVVDAEGEILSEIVDGSVANVAAYVLRDDVTDGIAARVRELAGETPVFSAAQPEPVAGFVVELLERRALSAPLYGLVLGGGKSTRMKRDKAALEYRGTPQLRYAYTLLQGVCEKVFLSNRVEQADDPLFNGLPQIHDRFLDIGPMGGILSAFHAHPEAAWLVLGCDLPFVDRATLDGLLAGRDPLALATCYLSAHDRLPEPLCAIYEPRYRRRLHQFLADGRDCPRKALINSRVRRLTLTNPSALDNINSPEEYEDALARIQAEVT